MIRRVAAGVAVAGFLFAIGCEPPRQPAPPPEPTDTVPPPTTAPGTTPQEPGVGAAPGAMDAGRQQAMDSSARQLDVIRNQIDQLRQQEQQVPQERRAEFDAIMARITAAYSNATTQLNRMRDAGEGQWQQVRDEVDMSIDELRDHVAEAQQLVGPGGQPGTQPGQQQPGGLGGG